MADLILDNMYLILLLPLWIFLIIMSARFFAIYVNNKIIYALTLLSSFLGTLFCSISLSKLTSTIIQTTPFVKIGNFTLYFGLQIDKLSLVMALILFLVSFLVQIFSISYLKDEPKKYRFFAYLNVFNFFMAGLFFSPNLFQMYFFWELAAVMSYLLIGFDYKNPEKSEASQRVFLMNRVGDTALLGAIILTSYFMYNYSGNLFFTSLEFEDFNAISTILYAYTSTPIFYLICACFIIGAAVKSAQFPFYTWLQDAMEAKLPVSALLHSATIVAAGVYLIIRMLPFFTLDNNLLYIISSLGIATALICSILASIETHPKKVLAYSTSANLGLVFLSVGALHIKAALIFLTAHAFIKSALFLCLNKKENYINYITFLICALSLAGLIFSGVTAKEFMFAQLENNALLAILFCISAFFTAFYIMRISLIMIKDIKLKNEINFSEYLPIAGLLLLNVLFYLLTRDKVAYKIAEPFWAALVGWALVYLLYRINLLEKFNKTPKVLERFYNTKLTAMYGQVAKISNFVDTRIFANYKPILFVAATGVRLFGWIETNVMNKSVSFVVSSAKKISELDSKIQLKNVQAYNAYAFILITIIISLIIIAYTLMLNQMS